MLHKTEIRVVLISSAAAVLIGLMSSLVTGYFLTKSNEIIADKDIALINAQNSQKYLEVVKQKAEVYIDSVMDFYVYIQMNDKYEVNRAKKLALVAQKNGFKLMIYVSPELASKSINLSLKLQAGVDYTDDRPMEVKMKELTQSAADWYRAYFIEVSTYNYQAMPNKFEADAISLLINSAFKS